MSKRRLSQDEARELVARAQSGDRAAEAALVEGHAGLVRRIALRYLTPGGLELDDLVQEGMLGVLHAARKYDLGRQTKFSSYASAWVIDKIQKACRRQPVIDQEGLSTPTEFGAQYNSDLDRTAGLRNRLDQKAVDGGPPPDAAPPDVSGILHLLPARERRLLTLLYGLDGEEPLTEREAGLELGCNQRRVNFLKQQAFRRIRAWRPLPDSGAA